MPGNGRTFGLENTRQCANARLLLAHRLRRWANINPALVHRIVSAGWSAQVNRGNIM